MSILYRRPTPRFFILIVGNQMFRTINFVNFNTYLNVKKPGKFKKRTAKLIIWCFWFFLFAESHSYLFFCSIRFMSKIRTSFVILKLKIDIEYPCLSWWWGTGGCLSANGGRSNRGRSKETCREIFRPVRLIFIH